ncbi:uncharacterized protein LOC112185214 [Rosa chinensis]|uniref:uncharacterized protein LOC112185214 n=1 Tax=Rosa chinensis TaxID=74649 RepID=UPI000D08D4E1|nr:uncharacterized protein LOC112185214 [Rosa chinensis]
MESSSSESLEVSVSTVAESVREEAGNMPEDERSSSVSLTTVLSPECRICQTEDSIDHTEAPCRCNGTLKFAHRDCIQRWVNSRFKATCEICNQYEGGYRVTVPPPATPPQPTRREIEEIRRVMEEAEGYRFLHSENLIIASNVGGGLQIRIGQPSPSPWPQLSPQFTRDNNSPGLQVIGVFGVENSI